MPKIYSQKWDLDSFFSGGSSSPELENTLKTLEQHLSQLNEELVNNHLNLAKVILKIQDLEMQVQELESFILCLVAQNVEDQKAIQLNEKIASLKSSCKTLSDQMEHKLMRLSEPDFEHLLAKPDVNPLAFSLKERREWAKEKMPLPQEHLLNQVMVDGYQGWEQLYESVMGHLRFPFFDGKSEQSLSVGQAENKLSHPNREIRQTMFHKWESTWQQQENSFAQVLNHIAGFRLKVYKERKWPYLKEALFYNRMEEKTLDTMWTTIAKNKGPLQSYLKKKASLLGLNQLSWFDVDAPLPSEGQSSISFQDAAELIITQFNLISPHMGQFAKMTFEKCWIESEDRSGKLSGGFCTTFPMHKQSRIFMTYSGTMNNVFTLAHELGHAYHDHIVHGLPYMAQQYRMNVAETASTLAELGVIDSVIKQTKNAREKQFFLDKKLQRSVIFLMNIHCRFLFESRLHQKRQNGFVMAGELNQLMLEAQQEAFCSALGEWHPHFWVAKKHFYITDVPFYNFPYTFGYLFSLGIYARAFSDSRGFVESYQSLLTDTGRMNVEDLAQKHLGINLRQPDFWQEGLNMIHRDVELFSQT